MRYATIKRAVLELIDQSTIAGEEVPLSYNNQADYVRKIPNLINQAITKIRTTGFPDRRTANLTEGIVRGAWVEYKLPTNCKELLSGGVQYMTDCGICPQSAFRLSGKSIFLPAVRLPDGAYCPPEDLPGHWYSIEFWAYPAQLPEDPEDEYNIDDTPDVIQAAEYYAASMLVMREDEYLHANLMNEYEARLAAMRPPVTAEVHPIVDVYEPPWGWGDGYGMG